MALIDYTDSARVDRETREQNLQTEALFQECLANSSAFELTDFGRQELRKFIMVDGDGFSSPREGTEVIIGIEKRESGVIYLSVRFTINSSGENHNVAMHIEEGLLPHLIQRKEIGEVQRGTRYSATAATETT